MFNVDENRSFLHVSFFNREFDFTSSFATLIIFFDKVRYEIKKLFFFLFVYIEKSGMWGADIYTKFLVYITP